MGPGSVGAHVRVGRHLHVGQVIGLLGNSGNTSAPHLHFHVIDKPSDLAGQGLPYVFDRFRLRDRMPLNLDVVDFPRRAWLR